MATYEYRCERHGVFDVMHPLGTAPPSVACTVCGSDAPRIVSAPMVMSGRRSAWSGAIERAERSRYEPEVVGSVPTAGARRRIRMAPPNPAFRSLPRP
jgi:putative FmdB family regulatory protein